MLKSFAKQVFWQIERLVLLRDGQIHYIPWACINVTMSDHIQWIPCTGVGV
jgi:hypothetical protein